MRILLKNISLKHLSVDITIVPGAAPYGRFIRESLAPTQQIAICDRIELDELNRNADVKALKDAGLVTVTVLREPGDLVEGLAPAIGIADGFDVIHVWVKASGSDATGTGEEDNAYQTVQYAVDRISEWLLAQIDQDLVLELPEFFAEDVRFVLPCPPKRRVTIRGQAETVLESGTLTAATDRAFTDSGAAFGATYQYAGRSIRLTAPDNSQQSFQIRDHDGTVIRSSIPTLGVTPEVGWGYEIVRYDAGIRSLLVTMPWVAEANAQFYDDPRLILHHLSLGGATPSTIYDSLRVDGGAVVLSGVYCTNDWTNAHSIVLSGSIVLSNGIYSYLDADPVFGLDALDFSTYFCEGLTSVSAYSGVRLDNAASFAGIMVGIANADDEGNGIGALSGQVTLQGGAFYNVADAINAEQPTSSVFVASGYGVPVLCVNCFRGVQSTRHSFIECYEVEFRGNRDDGFHARHFGNIKLQASPTSDAVEVPGIGIHARAGGRVELASTVQMVAGIPVYCDETSSTTEAVYYRYPLIGEGHSVVERVEGYDLPIDAYGSLHLYVDPAGTDIGAGTATQPLATVAESAERVKELLRREPDALTGDIVVHWSADYFDESVDFVLPAPPKKRIVFLGDRDNMTVNDSGTATSGTVRSITDTSKVWTKNQWKGQWVRLMDGAVEVALAQVRSNTTDTIRFGVYLLYGSVTAGWTYEIVVPATRINSFRCVMPWAPDSHNAGFGGDRTYGLPQVDLAYAQVGPFTPPVGSLGNWTVLLNGGTACFTAVRVVGTGQVNLLRQETNYLIVGGVWAPTGSGDDPVYQNADGDYDWMYSAGIWCEDSVLWATSGSYTSSPGSFVSTGPGGYYGFINCWASFWGGAIYDGSSFISQLGSYCEVQAYEPTDNPFLASDITANYAFRSKDHSKCGFRDIELDGAFPLYVLLADQDAEIKMDGVWTTDVGFDAVFGLASTRGSRVAIGPSCAGFSVGVGHTEVGVDPNVTDAGSRVLTTFAAVVSGSPAVGGDLSTVWRDQQ